MKKYLISLPLLVLLFFAPQTQAGQCFGETPADYYVEIVSGVNIRDAVCEGNVIGTLSAGAVVHVIGDLDGWVQVSHNGTVGFVWGDFVKKTTPPAGTEPVKKEPLWDVGDHMYKNAIWSLYNAGVVRGNDGDGSYQPDEKINRAAFTKIAIAATVENVPKSENGCLKDIKPGVWYTDFICYANNTLINGDPIIKGHPDGYFRPADDIRFAELSKILALIYGLEIGQGQMWYEGYIQALSDVNAIPPTIKTPDHFVTRGEMAEMMDRLMQKDTEQTSTGFNYMIQMPDDPVDPQLSDLTMCVDTAVTMDVDYAMLRDKALELTNQARSERSLAPITQSDVLDASSTVWALQGQFTHDRPNGQNLGDYEKSIGVTGFTAFAENLGEHSWNCESDCTDEAMTALENIHHKFMEEEKLPEGQRGHFENITGDYEDMGFGLSVQDGKMLLVFQYGKGIEGDAEQLCGNLQ